MAVLTPTFPTATDTLTTLGRVVNRGPTTIASPGVNSSATTIPITDTSVAQPDGVALIKKADDSAWELVSYTSKAAGSINGCIRGFDFSTAQSWVAGDLVYFGVITSAHHEALRDAIINTETKLGVGGSTPTAGTVLKGTATGVSSWQSDIGGGGVEYTDGDADATPTGSLIMSWDGANLWAASETNPIPVSGAISLTGEDHIGQVGGDTRSLALTPTVTTTAYTAGDNIGGKLAFTNAMRVTSGSGVVQSLNILDLSNQGAAMRLFLFDADITTPTDNAAWSLNSVDYGKLMGFIDVLTTDYITVDTKKIATVNKVIPVKANGSAILYGVLVAVGTPTYATTSALRLRLGLICD